MHGPVILYILGHIIHKHEIQHRYYADVQLTTSEDGNFHQLLSCLSEIKCCMSLRVLQLNENKSKNRSFCSSKVYPNFTKKKNTSRLPVTNVKPAGRNQGVIFDSDLSSEKQVTKVIQSCFLSNEEHLKNLSLISKRSSMLLFHLGQIIVNLTPSPGTKLLGF